jgi:hypothetical protein
MRGEKFEVAKPKDLFAWVPYKICQRLG